MKKIVIITDSFVDYNTGKLKIGGIETYLKDLSSLFLDKGYCVNVYQLMPIKEEKKININSLIVYLSKCVGKRFQESFDRIYEKENTSETLFVIATDQLSIRAKYKNVITIQHGIGYDMPGDMLVGFWKETKILQHVSKMLRCLKNLRRFYMSNNMVCVDYNYYNWLRTLGTIYPHMNVKVIPNYASNCIEKNELYEKLYQRNSCTRNIVFARRFVEYRGTYLFATVIKRLLKEYEDIYVTFAGDGPCRDRVIKMFEKDDRVTFTSFTASESISFHKKYDIAVVPTIYSEGTSLSLCESMAAGCFPICTHVGGMTNIVIDRYNGLMCAPLEDDLYKTIKSALDMPRDEFVEIVNNAYQTATRAFSIDNWKAKWTAFADDVMDC